MKRSSVDKGDFRIESEIGENLREQNQRNKGDVEYFQTFCGFSILLECGRKL